MAFVANTPVVGDFYGLSFVEKNTFLHFLDESIERAPVSRRKSVPVMATDSGSESGSSVAMECSDSASIDPLLAFATNKVASIVEKERVPHFLDESTAHNPICNRKTASLSMLVDSASVNSDPSFESQMHAKTACSHPQKEGQSMNWDSMEDVYTLMIKGIPCSCSKEDIMRAVHELGFLNLCDFFHVPTRSTGRKHKNIGYAFVGFSCTHVAKSFAKSMTGYKFKKESSKLVTVAPAAIQGYNDNLEHYRNTYVMASEFKPFFVEEGLV